MVSAINLSNRITPSVSDHVILHVDHSIQLLLLFSRCIVQQCQASLLPAL